MIKPDKGSKRASFQTHSIDVRDEQLIQNALGNPEAFRHLYKKYFRLLFKVVYTRLNNLEDTEELVSQIFIKTYFKLGSYTPSKSSFKTWLMKITQNSTTDFLRKKKLTTTNLFEYLPESTSSELSQIEDRVLIRKLLQKIKPSLRNLIRLKFILGYSNREIAQKKSISLANVNKMVQRTLRQLRQISNG